ncbi:MAG: RAMP superfamily protein [Chloroflexaceae bacterium]|nr:RAMP superfamily protein [Chloroflexaceae bacterium]
MREYWLTVNLESDATFGRGEGVAGLVDTEIEHDPAGCPFVNGRTLKGWLVEAWLDIRHALPHSMDEEARRLFGQGSDHQAELHIGAATLPPNLRAALHADVQRGTLQPADLLTVLTTIRRQTAVDHERDTPQTGSLRSLRALRRDTLLIAPLHFERDPAPTDLQLLAACALGVRRGGLGRNRGRGKLLLRLHDQQPTATAAAYGDATFTHQHFAQFVQDVHKPHGIGATR